MLRISFLILFLGSFLLFSSEKLEPTIALQLQWQQIMEKKGGSVEFADFWDFNMKYSPDLLEEWAAKNKEEKKLGLLYLDELAENYLFYMRLKRMYPEEYQSRIQMIRDEFEIRALGRKIVGLKKESVENKTPEKTAQLTVLTTLLKKKLKRSFEQSQQRQHVELIRLENEMSQLKKLYINRQKNKKFILNQRFDILCGNKK